MFWIILILFFFGIIVIKTITTANKQQQLKEKKIVKPVIEQPKIQSQEKDRVNYKITYPKPGECEDKEFYEWVEVMPLGILEPFYQQNKSKLKMPKHYWNAIRGKILEGESWTAEEYMTLLEIKKNNSIKDLDSISPKKEYSAEESNTEAKPKRKYTRKKKYKELEIQDFTAIDFETATQDGMACQLGIVVVRNRNIVHEKEFLFQPPNNKYSEINSRVHHITAKDTETAPTFCELWPDIESYFEGQIIVGHNIGFDLSVLTKNIEYYNLNHPNIADSVCTCKLHKNQSLDIVCEYYNIPLEAHHNALCDAKTCALIYLKYIERGIFNPDIKIAPSKKKDVFSDPNRHLSHDVKIQDLSNVRNPNTIFYNKKIVISGVFSHYPIREDLAHLLKDYGADINTSISRRTHIFLIGSDYGEVKMRKVEEINSSGGSIQILSETDLYKELQNLN